MLRIITSLSLVLMFLKIPCYSQNINVQNNSAISRFQYKGYKTLQEFIRRNAEFLDEAAMNTGVLLAGIILDYDGEISDVFTCNSLEKTVDTSILALLKKTEGHWKQLEDTTIKNTFDTLIVPIIFRFMGTEYKIDRANSKLAVEKEVEITKLIYGQPVGVTNYESTKSLLKLCNSALAKENFDEAEDILKDLVKREPLNSEYYSKLIMVNVRLGHKFSACNNLKYLQNYLVVQPESSFLQGLDCQ